MCCGLRRYCVRCITPLCIDLVRMLRYTHEKPFRDEANWLGLLTSVQTLVVEKNQEFDIRFQCLCNVALCMLFNILNI